MPLPHSIGRFNKATANRVTSPFAARLPGFGIVNHRGRKSGRGYRTPVNVFRSGDRFTFPLTYGRGDWIQNVLAAGEARVLTRGATYDLTKPRIVRDRDRSRVPVPVRAVLRALNVDEFLVMETPAIETDRDST